MVANAEVMLAIEISPSTVIDDIVDGGYGDLGTAIGFGCANKQLHFVRHQLFFETSGNRIRCCCKFLANLVLCKPQEMEIRSCFKKIH